MVLWYAYNPPPRGRIEAEMTDNSDLREKVAKMRVKT
jgi:hypothetical protein